LRELRSKRGLSQTELAKLVGVTSSTISQVESNSIYPSLPALLKMAEILSVEVNSFFQDTAHVKDRVIFTAGEAVDIKFQDLPEGGVRAKLLTPLDFEPKVEPYLIEIPPDKELPSHFFIHKGEEMGYLLSGKLQLKFRKAVHTVNEGDVVYLTSEIPTQWRNPGPDVAKLLWIKVK
jgi:transcriptional regulator with XRE-family HTH domain